MTESKRSFKFYVVLMWASMLIVPLEALAQNLLNNEQNLKVINDFAKNMCTTVPLVTTGSSTKLNADAQIKLAGLFKKFFDIGASAAVEHSSSQSQGVLQADLVKAIKDANECRVHIFDTLWKSLVSTAASPPAPPAICESLIFAARDYTNAKNIGVGTLSYGAVITNGGDGSKAQENMVEFSFRSELVCNYRLDVEYAALQERSVTISFNDSVVAVDGLAEKTGGWDLENQKVLPQGAVTAKKGLNTLRFFRTNVFPHIKSVRLVSTPG